MKRLVLLTLALVPALISYTQTDTAFWFAAPDISSAFNYDRPILLRITSYQQPCIVTISQPAGGGLPTQTFSMLPNTTQSVDLTTWISNIECGPGNIIQNKGIKITADNKIAAYYEVNANGPNPEFFALKGRNATGNEFYISSQYILGNSPVLTPLPLSSFNIVATEDNTSVTITPAKNIVGHSAGIPFVITLNRGQTYAAIATSQAASQHLQGSHVTATKPVAITLSDDLLQGLAFGGACEDLAGDQTVPVSITGNEYIAIKSNLNSPFDKVYITATQDATSISQDGVLVTNLNAGQSAELTVSNNSTYIQSSAPVYAYQLSGVGCEVGSALLPKINCTGSSSVSIARSTNDAFIITLLVKNGGQNNFLVNNVSGVITAAQFTVVPATGGQWYAAKVTLSLANYPNGSVVKITNSTNIFQLGVLQGGVLGVGVGYFSDFNSLEAHASTSLSTLCRGAPIQLSAEFIGSATYSWTGPNGFTSNAQNPVINNAAILNSGTYHLTVTVPGCGTYLDSVVITVNDCANSIGNIINTYTPVLAFGACRNEVTVENGSTFNVGDTILMIQMKGAVIDSSNTAAFGTITDYKNAGNYEFNYVKSKTGNIIELKNKLTRQYDIPAGKVQLIRVPYYNNSITVTSTLTCLPWDGNKGGVLVLNVLDTINLNTNIDVSGKGFKGGIGFNSQNNTLNCFQNNYNYPVSSNANAGQKGESIASISQNIICGKGSPAGGGGGGLGHNSGGGGGANGGGGGLGGYQLEPCGNSPYDNRGIGGHALAYSTAINKIYMGSGGGAGQADNAGNQPPGGGNGAGIIIMLSNTLKSNSFSIRANGDNGVPCSIPPSSDCHDGMGGGGAGGTILMSVNQLIDNTIAEHKGGKGADMVGEVTLSGRIGSGGGGGGGLLFLKSSSLPGNLANVNTGGTNGVLTQDANNPWGATPGQPGAALLNLVVPFDAAPFIRNIDSVRIKDSSTSCSAFDFKGLGYTNTSAVNTWQWYFGDGGNATTQNTSHTYSLSGNYPVKLVVTDINGCKDSITKNVLVSVFDFDFSYKANTCNPLSVQFNATGSGNQNPYWAFGDAATISGTLNPLHTYAAEGIYTVKYSLTNSACSDTITKTISVTTLKDDIILTHDTTLCAGASKQLLTSPSLSFCWNPSIYLNNPNLSNPITTTPQNITYFYTAEVTGANVITNGDFNGGNTGFTSQYTYATPNITEGQYFVGPNPPAWNSSLSNCHDHTSGNGNMMLVNGAPVTNVNVWKQTVTVIPNTNYAFSTWIQALFPPNPAQLQFSINNKDVGTLITASLPTCTWTQFYTTWNSGNNATATISIVNKNTQVQGNDFALDDISFAPVFIKRDSVKITVETPVVTATNSTAICDGMQIQLNAAGAATYSWTGSGLNDPNIANPVATPAANTRYIVTGTTANGCIAKDTVDITIKPKPLITKSNDDTICNNSSIQLFANGGIGYSWSPATTLNNPSAPNPVATPLSTTKYYVTVTGANTCTNTDSIKISIYPTPVFTISAPSSICVNNSIQLVASGGDTYDWQPAGSLNNPAIPNPNASPLVNTTYSVQITDTVCNNSSLLSTVVTVLSLPAVLANKSNDIDCSYDQSQLTATGAAQYSWSPAATLNNPSVVNPIARPTITTEYTVKGTDQAGCINYDKVTVNVSGANKGGYLMPTAFTPNNDGLNDCYGLKYWGTILELEFSIYNRWGERVFYTKNPSDCWNGNYRGILQDPAVFIYMIKAKTTCEGSVFRKGTFALIR